MKKPIKEPIKVKLKYGNSDHEINSADCQFIADHSAGKFDYEFDEELDGPECTVRDLMLAGF